MNYLIQKLSSLEEHREGIGPVFALLILRLWLGMRSILSGIEKYSWMKPVSRPAPIGEDGVDHGLKIVVYVKEYGLEFYKGIPDSLRAKFIEEPLISESLLNVYDMLLGPAFIALGILLILGVLSRLSLLAMGLLYTSLTFGLVLLNQPSGVAWLAIHVLLVAWMLYHFRYNRFGLSDCLKSSGKLSILKNL